MHYIHTQRIPREIVAAGALAGLVAGFTVPGRLARLALWGIFGATAATFRSLTVEVDDTDVKLQFGGGLIKRSFPLECIRSVSQVKTTLLQGWGMRCLGDGWLYNIYGLDAVELQLHSGKRALIGTDESQRLAEAISEKIGR